MFPPFGLIHRVINHTMASVGHKLILVAPMWLKSDLVPLGAIQCHPHQVKGIENAELKYKLNPYHALAS